MTDQEFFTEMTRLEFNINSVLNTMLAANEKTAKQIAALSERLDEME